MLHKRIIYVLLFLIAGNIFAAVSTVNIQLTPESCMRHGRVLADNKIPTVLDVAKDAYCAKHFMSKYAPLGTVTVFGSSRTEPGTTNYVLAQKFSYLWTKISHDKYPILTGGGPGIMEAANLGAKQAKGYSLYFATYFKHESSVNSHGTHGFVFTSLAQKTSDMVDYSAAIVVLPGGYGTEWEIFETLTKLQTTKKYHCPVIFLGGKKVWHNLLLRINYLEQIGTISAKDVKLFHVVNTPEQAVAIIKKALLSD